MTDAADDFDALFDEVSAQRVAPKAAAAPAAPAEDDMEALFDQVSATRVAAPAVLAAVPDAGPAPDAEAEVDLSDKPMFERLGGIWSLLQDSLRELG